MKRVISYLLVLCMVIPMVSTVLAAQKPASKGQSVADWEYVSLEEGLELTAYHGTDTDVYVPSEIDDQPVIKLGDGLFENNDALNSVTLGNGITEIGARAFYDCDNLVCIVTNEQLTTIGTEAFYSCNGFHSVILYDTVSTIGEGAFTGCLSVTVWCNEGSAAYSYMQENSIAYEILNPDATPEIYTQDGITYYIMNGEAIAIDFDQSTTEIHVPAVVEGYPVTQLRETFRDCGDVTEVLLPESLRIISSYAFNNCKKLRGLTLPNSLNSIGEYAFGNCYSMEAVNIGVHVTNIGGNAFYNCDGLTDIVIPDSVTSLGSSAFSYCDHLKTVVIGEGLQTIEEKVFYCCKTLTDVTIGQSVASIGRYAFSDCIALDSITIPGNVTEIGHAAFSGCSQLTSVTLSEGIRHIDSYGFSECSSLTEVILPRSMESIAASLFGDCTALTSVVIPDTVSTIGNYAFYNCQSLSEIIIPESVTQIGSSAFKGCSGLSKIVIPQSVESLYTDTFPGNCILLVFDDSYAHRFAIVNDIFYVLYDGTNEPVVVKKDGVTYCLTDGNAIAIDFDNSRTDVTIPATVEGHSVTELRETFRDCSSLTSVTLPAGITHIGSYTFYGCTGLTAITLPETITKIGNSAFSDCSGLLSVTIPEGVTQIGSSAFSYCTALTGIVIPNKVTAIENYTFSGCASLEYVSLPDTMRTIGISAFYNCDSLTSVVLPDLVTDIGKNAFNGCDGLQSVIIGKGVTTMGDQAFYMCRNLTSLKIEDGATTIGVSAFYNCDRLTSVVIPDSVTAMGNDAFANCYALTSVTIGNGITKIEYSTFARCESLTEVKFGENLTTIGNAAFDGCNSLSHVTIPEGVTTIEGFAFRCNNMNTVVIPQSVINLSSSAFPDTTILLVYEGSAAYDTATRNDLLYFVYDGTEEPLVVRQDGVTYCVLSEKAIAIAFDGSLTSLVLPETVAGYPLVELRETFNGCKKLTSVVLPEGLQIIGSNAFLYCSKLSTITIPDSVTTIGSSAFSYCSGLVSVDMGQGVTLIDAGAFSRCSQLTAIEIPDGVTHIGSTAFYLCTGLKEITIPESVTDIGGLAFQDCDNLVSVTIPHSVVNMGSSVFSSCNNLTTVVIGNGIKKIQSNAFSNCGKLETVIVGKSVTGIAASAFANCNNLRQIVIPETITSLKANSFATNTILIVCKDSYAHNFAAKNNLLYFVIHKSQNPEIAHGAAISGMVIYTDGTAVGGATVEILYDDGTVKETVTTDVNGAYAFTYAEVGRYTIRVTDGAGNTASSVVSVKRMNAFDVFLAGDTDLTLKKGWTVSGTISDSAGIVTITDSNGNALDSVESADGSFVFNNIPNGSYIIKAETEVGIATREITVFDGDVTDVTLAVATENVTIWGYVEVEDREYQHHRRNWVQVSLYNAEGIVVAQTKSDKDGMYRFEKLPIGQYSIVAETAEMRPDKHHRYDRSYVLTGYAYVDAAAAGEYQADTIILYEENDSLATISGKVTAQGEHQACQVVLRNVFRHEIAQQTTGKNGKYSFTNIRDGLYFVVAVTENEGMGYTVVAVRHGKVYGQTDIYVIKADKVEERDERFCRDFHDCNDRDTALQHRDRIVEEKRFYDGLSEKEKKQLSKEYVDRLNRMCQWIADCEYVTDDEISVQQGGLVISGDELKNGDTVSFELSVEMTEGWNPNADGVKEDKDFLYHDMHDKAGKGHIKQYYEICMSKTVDGKTTQITSVTKDTDATGKFRITMPIPEEYRGHKHYTMLHVHNGETVVLADLDEDPNTITFEVDAFSTFALTGTDEILIPVTHAQVWQDAELYGNYVSLEEAVNGCQGQAQYVKLVEDTVAELTLQQDLYVDLNGYDLTGTIITNGYQIYGMDSTTNGYTCQAMGYFHCVDENGVAIVPQKQFAGAESMRYMAIATENGYTFHRFFLGITHMSLKPSVTGFGYKAEFYGDEMVQEQVASMGYSLWITESYVVSRSKDGFHSSLTLRLSNFDAKNHGDTPVYACVTITLADGTVIQSAVQSNTLRSAVETVNANYADYSQEQLTAVREMILQNAAMQSWQVENIWKEEI